MAWVRRSDGTRVQVKAEDIWGSAKERAERARAAREWGARNECQRRIYEVADQHAQMNMAAAAAGGLLSDDQMNAWRAGLLWVQQMRATWQPLAAGDADISADASWPECPAAARALADAF